MKYEVKVTEFPDDNKSTEFKTYKKIVNIPNENVRKELICTFCGFSLYPDCKEKCHNFDYNRIKIK